MPHSCHLGTPTVEKAQVESEKEATALVVKVALAKEALEMERVVCNISGKASPHRPEDTGIQWQRPSHSTWRMHLS